MRTNLTITSDWGNTWDIYDNQGTSGWISNTPIWIDHTKTTPLTNPVVTTNDIVTTSSWSISENRLSQDELEFFELVLSALGVNVTFEEFSKMSKDRRKSLLREIKINLITKNANS